MLDFNDFFYFVQVVDRGGFSARMADTTNPTFCANRARMHCSKTLLAAALVRVVDRHPHHKFNLGAAARPPTLQMPPRIGAGWDSRGGSLDTGGTILQAPA